MPDILQGIIALVIALLIFSVITEKIIFLVRSYPRRCVVLSIGACLIFIFALWFNSEFVPNFQIKLVLLFLIYIPFHVLLILNYNYWAKKLEVALRKLFNGYKLDKKSIHFVNGAIALFFHLIMSIWLPRRFAFWNFLFFGLLFLFIQSLLYKDILISINKGSTGSDKDQKENEISVLSLMIGIIVSFLFHANILEMFEYALKPVPDLHTLFSWKDKFVIQSNSRFIYFSKDFNPFTREIVGIAICGFFLSFGSKFFHDMLDLLFQIKNIRKNINEEKFQNIATQKETVDSLFQELDNVKLDKNVKSQIETLKQPSIFGIERVYDNNQQKVIVHDDGNGTVQPSQLRTQLSQNLSKQDGIEITKGEINKTLTLGPASDIANIQAINNGHGALGAIVTKINSGGVFLLTCYHVVRNQNHLWDFFYSNGHELVEVHNQAGQPIGKIVEAIRNNELDVALVALNPGVPYRTNVGNITNKPYKIRTLTDNDIKNKISVRMQGLVSQFRQGNINGKIDACQIEYEEPNGRKSEWHMDGLYTIQSRDGQPFSRPGDSSSVVFDDDDCAIGMIVCGNSYTSKMIPISKVFKTFNVKFI